MTVADVEKRLEEIREVADGCDAEVAHIREKELWQAVLKAIAAGEIPADQVQAVAAKAIESDSIEFSRWYA